MQPAVAKTENTAYSASLLFEIEDIASRVRCLMASMGGMSSGWGDEDKEARRGPGDPRDVTLQTGSSLGSEHHHLPTGAYFKVDCL